MSYFLLEFLLKTVRQEDYDHEEVCNAPCPPGDVSGAAEGAVPAE